MTMPLGSPISVTSSPSLHSSLANGHSSIKSDPAPLAECQVSCRIPTSDFGTFRLLLYKNQFDNEEHTALVFGEGIRSSTLERNVPGETEMDRRIRGASPSPSSDSCCATSNLQQTPILTRLHSACFTGETVCSARCDCAEQLYESMRMMHQEGQGVIVYLKQEGRGIGLLDKLKAYNLQDMGHDTVSANILLSHPPDNRNYKAATWILKDLGVQQVKLLTNNPEKIKFVESNGIEIVERISMIPLHWKEMNLKEKDGVEKPVAPSLATVVSSIAHASSAGCPCHDSASRESSPCPSISQLSSYSSVASPLSHVYPIPASRAPSKLDEYIITKVERMQHMLDIPLALKNAQ